MATNKLTYFEYAGHAECRERPDSCSHLYDACETPNGFALIVAGNNLESGQSPAYSRIAIDRIRYYLLHEELENPQEAVRNAMIYANGFMFVTRQKDSGIEIGELSCMCVLIRDRKVYYAWVGQIGLYLFTSSRLITLSQDVFNGPDHGDKKQAWKISFLGQTQSIMPGVSSQAYVPANDDMLLMGTNSLYLDPDEKSIRKILSDSMPTHTKAQRLVKNIAQEDLPAACQLIRFYNLESGKPTYATAPSTGSIVKDVDEDAESQPGDETPVRPVRKYILTALVVLILGYMVYDLFLFNPRPAKEIIQEQSDVEQPAQTSIDRAVDIIEEGAEQSPEPGMQSRASGQAVPLPEDIVYVVKSGDTWGKIYREYEVCSWFIRNHPPNAGKFDQANNPVAGSSLVIPAMYSGRQKYNPSYYQEFSLEKVGSACQQANQAFINSFKDKIGAGNPSR